MIVDPSPVCVCARRFTGKPAGSEYILQMSRIVKGKSHVSLDNSRPWERTFPFYYLILSGLTKIFYLSLDPFDVRPPLWDI